MLNSTYYYLTIKLLLSFLDDFAQPVLTPEKNRVVAESCRELLHQSYDHEGAGYYWISVDNKMVSIFCDFETDRGKEFCTS